MSLWSKTIASGLAVLFAFVNTYLTLTLGVLFVTGFAALSVAVIVGLSKSIRKDLSVEEIVEAQVIATSTVVVSGFALSIFIRQNRPQANLPSWLVPENVARGGASWSYWLLPIAAYIFIGLVAALLALTLAWVLRKKFTNPDAYRWPSFSFLATTIKNLPKSPGVIAKALIVGFALNTLQWALVDRLFNSELIDITGSLGGRLSFGIALNLVFLATAFLMGTRVGFSVGVGTVGAWLLIVPLAVLSGSIQPQSTWPSFYSAAEANLFMFPAVVILVSASLAVELKQWMPKLRSYVTHSVGMSLFRGTSFSKATRWKGSYSVFALLASLAGIYALGSGILAPLPLFLALVLVIFLSTVAALAISLAQASLVAETGSAVGGLNTVLLLIPIYLVGYRAYGAYAGMIFVNSFVVSFTLGQLYVARVLGVPERVVLKSAIIGIVISTVTSVISIAGLTVAFGLGSSQVPVPNLFGQLALLDVLSAGTLGNSPSASLPVLLTAVGTGIILPYTKKLSATGIALGILLPVAFGLAILLGGTARFILDRMRPSEGPTFAQIAMGLILGSVLSDAARLFLSLSHLA